MKKFSGILILGVITLLLLGVFIFQKSFQQKETPSQEAITVKAISVQEESIQEFAKYVGVVKGETISKLSFQVPGKVKVLYTQKGELVKKGDPLAQIEPNRLELGTAASTSQILSASNQVTKAKEAYQFAESTFKNISTLFQSGGASQNDYDQAALNLELAKADLKSAEEQKRLAQLQGQQTQLNLDDSTLYAPYDGYVIDFTAEVGETTGAGIPVVIYRTPDQLIEVGVSQKDYAYFKVNTAVDVFVDGIKYKGVVATREDYPNAETRTYTVEVQVESAAFSIGALCTVQVQKLILTGFKIPINALIYNNSVQVYKVTEGKVNLVEITVLDLQDDVAIVSGLQSGDTIVTEGIKRLKVGDAVALIE